MGIEQVITIAVNAYLEREKAKQDQERAIQIIHSINLSIEANRTTILNALKDALLDELTGLYLGQVSNFKEYDPNKDHKYILTNMAYDINEKIWGPLVNLYDNENDLPRVRKIVNLMVLALHLRALVLSELKYKHSDNRDSQLLEQLHHLKYCCKWVVDKQYNDNWKPAFNKWNDCESNPPSGTTCVPLPESDPIRRPTSCCTELFYSYKIERDLLDKDKVQQSKVNESISHLESEIVLIH